MDPLQKIINGVYVMDALTALGEPVYLSQVIMHVARNRDVDPRLIEDVVSDTIRTGIRHGFIYQAKDGKLCNFRKDIRNEILGKDQSSFCTTSTACTPVTTASHESFDRRAIKRCYQCKQVISKANNSVDYTSSGNLVDSVSDTSQSTVSSGVTLNSEDREYLADSDIDNYSDTSMPAEPITQRTAENADNFSENKKPQTPKKK